jgi:hypothetical protein
VRPFGLSDGAFDSYMIDFPIVICALSLGVEFGVGVSGNCEDCAVGGEGFKLLWGFLDLWQWWWRRVGFCLDLRIGVIWHWVCDLWHNWRICYSWSWRRMWMVGCGIVV